MSTLTAIHPRQALFGTGRRAPALPVCDHYAGSEALMRKSLLLQAQMGHSVGRAVFDLTLDLEDGAPVGAEQEHAQLAAELINSPDNVWRRVGVRVHDVQHPRFEEDLETIIHRAGQRVAYIMVPKLSGVRDAARAIEAIQNARRRHGVERRIPVHGLIETHRALQQVQSIADLAGMESLSFGLMDFVSEHRGALPASAMSAKGQFTHPLVLRAKLEIAAACHASGLVPSHCVVTEFKDMRTLAAAAEKACQELGYTRMWSIHPAQIPVIVEAFSPVAAEVDDAVDILREAQKAHWAPTSYRDTLHDRASYRHYWHVLERAWLTGQPLPEDIQATFFVS